MEFNTRDLMAAIAANLPQFLRASKYNPNQPRDKEGTPTGGQWTKSGGPSGMSGEELAYGIEGYLPIPKGAMIPDPEHHSELVQVPHDRKPAAKEGRVSDATLKGAEDMDRKADDYSGAARKRYDAGERGDLDFASDAAGLDQLYKSRGYESEHIQVDKGKWRRHYRKGDSSIVVTGRSEDPLVPGSLKRTHFLDIHKGKGGKRSAADWDESKHPRVPEGSKGGGQFTDGDPDRLAPASAAAKAGKSLANAASRKADASSIGAGYVEKKFTGSSVKEGTAHQKESAARDDYDTARKGLVDHYRAEGWTETGKAYEKGGYFSAEFTKGDEKVKISGKPWKVGVEHNSWGDSGGRFTYRLYIDHTKPGKRRLQEHEAMNDLRSLSTTTGRVRRDTLMGEPHLVVPVTALVEGVVFAHGATTPEFVPASSFGRVAKAWDVRPVMAGHPQDANGVMISAADPRVLDQRQIGWTFSTRMGRKLEMEAWVNERRALLMGGDAEDVVRRLQRGETIEVSIGAHVDIDASAEGEYQGRAYRGAWRSTLPDHLAFLKAGDRGACSIEMGCGAQRSAEEMRDAAWDESKHPRVPEGNKGGGQFSGKDGPSLGRSIPAFNSIDEDTLEEVRRDYFTDRYEGDSHKLLKKLGIRGRQDLEDSDAHKLLTRIIRTTPAAQAREWSKVMDEKVRKESKSKQSAAKKHPLLQRLHDEDDEETRVEIKKKLRAEGIRIPRSLMLSAEEWLENRYLDDLSMRAAVDDEDDDYEDPDDDEQDDDEEEESVIGDEPTDRALILRSACDGKEHTPDGTSHVDGTPCACKGASTTTRKDTTMDDARIKALIASPRNHFTDKDTTFLKTLNESQFSALEASDKDAQPLVIEKKVEVQAPTPRSAEEFLNFAPAGEVRDMLADGLRAGRARKDGIVAQLVALGEKRCPFTKEQLGAMSIGDLDRLVSLAGIERPVENAVDFSGLLPRAAGENTNDKDNVFLNPPDPYAAGIKALQEKQQKAS